MPNFGVAMLVSGQHGVECHLREMSSLILLLIYAHILCTCAALHTLPMQMALKTSTTESAGGVGHRTDAWLYVRATQHSIQHVTFQTQLSMRVTHW